MCSTLQGARAVKPSVSTGNGNGSSSSSTVSHAWTLPSLRWVPGTPTGREPPPSSVTLNHNTISDGIRGRNSNSEKDQDEMVSHTDEVKSFSIEDMVRNTFIYRHTVDSYFGTSFGKTFFEGIYIRVT